MSMNPSPSLGLKAQRLQLAECLKSKADAASASSAGGAATAAGGTVAPATPAPGARSGSSRGQKAACALATPASPTRSFDFITVELSKEPGCTALGIEVNDSLRVEGVDEDGLVDRHNLRQESDASRVLPGDRIIEVNGVQRDPSMMLLECKVRQRLVFTIVRDVAGLPPAAATATTTCGSTGDGRGSLGGISTLATASGERDGVPSAEPSPMPLEAPPQAPQPQGADEAAEPLAEEAAAAAAALAAGSPQQTRLRPEARVFVPSSAKKEGANVQGPPGLEMCDAPAVAAATVAGAQAGAAEAAGGSSEGRGQAVKRALFR